MLIGVWIWIWQNKGSGKIEIIYETAEQVQKRKDTKMAQTLEEYTKSQTGKYAVKVVRLVTEESYGFNETATMAARSVIKVPIILTAIRLGYGDTYNDLLMRMGKNSDNNAQIKMEKYLGMTKIQNTLEILGMTNTDFGGNTTTADDLVKMWKYIYESPDKEKAAEFLTNSIYEDRISKGIPEGVRLIHKVGTDINVWNDSGIVLNSKPFILVILNQGVTREEAVIVVPELTKMVWDYETSL